MATKSRSGHGGARPGAGRKRTLPGPPRVSHQPRPVFDSREPLHITTRLAPGLPSIRTRHGLAIVVDAARAIRDEPGFRLCHYSIQKDHLHFLCEASAQSDLSRGMKRLKMRIARPFNLQLGRSGSVFLDRYDVEVLRSSEAVRAALLDILNNARKHGEPLGKGQVDPFSSAWYFDGWKSDAWRNAVEAPTGLQPVTRPESWLLTIGWREHGPLGVNEVPPARKTSRTATPSAIAASSAAD